MMGGPGLLDQAESHETIQWQCGQNGVSALLDFIGSVMPVAVTWNGTSPNQLLETCKALGVVSRNQSEWLLVHEIKATLDAAPPSDWIQTKNHVGETYWFNKSSGQTSTTSPLSKQLQSIADRHRNQGDKAAMCEDPWILFRDVKGENYFYSLEAQGIYNEAQFSVLSAMKQDAEIGSSLRENQLQKMALIEAENAEMLKLKRKKREKVERATRHYLFNRCSKIFNAFRLLAMENGKCLHNAHKRILSLREETISSFLLAWRALSATCRASRKKTSALHTNVSTKACRRAFVEWREFTITIHRNKYTALFLERWKYICVSRFRREENKRRANALRAKMLKKTWLKCWHDEFLIEKAARLVVQNAAAVKIQVLYRDYRTRSKTAQLLAQKKKALLAKFVYQGQEFVADNPDGAHMQGLNANMIQANDESGNEDLVALNHDNLRELSDVEKQVEESERNVDIQTLLASVSMIYAQDETNKSIFERGVYEDE